MTPNPVRPGRGPDGFPGSTGDRRAEGSCQRRTHDVKTRIYLAAAILCCVSVAPTVAGADPHEVRREVREGARSVVHERREAAREMRSCQSRECVLREMREGQREVNREQREAYREVRQERSRDYYPSIRHDPDGRYDRDHRYHGNGNHYGWNDRNGRYDGNHYGWRNDRDAHYHPGGHYCRDGRHIVHLRDAYYRGDRRWYRDGRYWNEPDYVARYYRHRNRQRGDNDFNDDFLRGAVVGAAVVGVIAAIHEANDND